MLRGARLDDRGQPEALRSRVRYWAPGPCQGMTFPRSLSALRAPASISVASRSSSRLGPDVRQMAALPPADTRQEDPDR
jgi:hypothetical protein